ncbi:MAG: Fur family transcriptional regulator [Anaerosomatales bacterium]|nr:Fur family transcriptional regulator [Anaerosomatales bacterium]GAV32278.1 fe2+/Zn2+ uptake regulation proteins [Coriobacteriaceae bacterium EMTCatB1]
MSAHPPDFSAAARLPYGTRRVSRARAAIAEAASEMRGAFTAERLHERVAREHPGIGLATVYRAVAAMTEAGYLARVGARDGAALYAVCASEEHHHHAVCESCGAVAPVACTLVRAALPPGFAVTHHELAIYGMCADCARRSGEVGA